ncbi:ribose import ATP-binding protein RbsA [Peptococcaceae bacterium CEB3]|nr:ribose import ATP-binding protein RbsA [Peptococcaceae bacterium CEB3]
MADQAVLRLEGISKAFPGVQALESVSLDVGKGEILGLVGENGAGKSTLIKMISGMYVPDQGQIYFQGQAVRIESPRRARELGISTVYQELALSPYLSVAENIFMGRLPKRWGGCGINWRQLYSQTRELLAEIEIDLAPRLPVEKLSVAYRQQVEIARALSGNARVIIFDEPTAVLTEEESVVLFRNVRRLAARGVAIIYVSHRLAEVLNLSDRITCLRDGKAVGAMTKTEASYDGIVKLMVGRELDKDLFTRDAAPQRDVVLEAERLSQGTLLKEISFELRRGEVLGLYGLVGSGRTELARLLFGLARKSGGSVKIKGRVANIQTPRTAIKCGMGFLPEERRSQGLVLELDVAKNMSLANHSYLTRWGFLRSGEEKRIVQRGIKELTIKTPGLRQKVANLSGGNQQKVILARWLTRMPKPDILILDEPTRGVDVGAKAEIHRLIRELAGQGMSVLMISSDLPEILSVSDRILVMREGRLAGEISQHDATEEVVVTLATGT